MSNNTLPFSDVYNNLGICTGLTTLGSYSIPSLSTIYNSVSNPTAPQSLGSGYFSNDIYSANYVQGQNGWKLFYNGNFEANNGTFRGALTVGTNAFHVDTSGNMWWGSSTTYSGATIKISSAGSVNFTTGNFSGTLSSGISITSPSITGGTISGTSITGSTVTTTGGTFSVRLNNTTNQVELLYSNVVQGVLSAYAYPQGVAISMTTYPFVDGDSGTGIVCQEGTTSIIHFFIEGNEVGYVDGAGFHNGTP